MQVNRIGTMIVESCKLYEPVSLVAERMKNSGVGILPVLVDDERVVGVLTDRDIVTRCLGIHLNPATTYVKEIMTEPVCWIYADAELDEAVRMMAEHRLRRLIIKDHQHHAVGILSLDDIAIFTCGDETVGRVLELVSRGTVAGARTAQLWDMSVEESVPA